MSPEVESFEYFSPQGLPWVCLAWACIYLFRPIATLVHELGHALVAIILTKEKVFLTVGTGKPYTLWKGRRMEVSISIRNSIFGVTSFSENTTSRLVVFFILLGGPVSSIIFSILGMNSLLNFDLGLTAKSALIGWTCINILVFLRSILPMTLQGTSKISEGVPSDGLQLYKILRGLD